MSISKMTVTAFKTFDVEIEFSSLEKKLVEDLDICFNPSQTVVQRMGMMMKMRRKRGQGTER